MKTLVRDPLCSPVYCLSAQKSQGQSLNQVGFYFTADVFAHGQLYTALSRANGWNYITILMEEGKITLTNVVHAHILGRAY